MADAAPSPEEPTPEPAVEQAPGAPEVTRSWFPESFLWQPLVETGDDGVASVPVRVPDQLTTWRVLALAHDRAGHQAGAEHTFDGTLPVYVEPVVPGWLYAGDTVVLPIQAVNTTSSALSGRVVVEASGALSGSVEAPVALSAGGSDVKTLSLTANGAGPAGVKATLRTDGASDAAERVVPVRPTGRPVEKVVGGTLTASRTLSLPGPREADRSTEHVEVMVFPGPLSVLQAELDRLGGGGGDGAYAFALSSELVGMAEALQVELPPDAVRRLQIVAWQQVARRSLSPSGGEAADLLLGLRRVSGHALAEGRRGVLVQKLVAAQRADGTFSRDARSTAQRVLVETAVAGMVLPDDQRGPRLRAQGALERLMGQVDDPYTAAVLVASGLLSEERAAELRSTVREGLTTVDGVTTLSVPVGVKNPWGLPPSRAEGLAVAALALSDDPASAEVAGDLVAQLMQGWSARAGFGAGPADPLALDAVVRALPGTPQAVTVSLWVDGVEASRAELDPTQPKVPGILKAPTGGGRFELKAEPAVPGLAFVATRRSWVPWTEADRLAGVDVEVEVGPQAVGRTGALTLRVSAPKGTAVTLEQGLPPGAAVDEASLLAHVAAARVLPDRLVLTTRPLGAGEVLEVVVPVTPGFAGRFHTAPLTLEAEGQRQSLRPAVWTVGG